MRRSWSTEFDVAAPLGAVRDALASCDVFERWLRLGVAAPQWRIASRVVPMRSVIAVTVVDTAWSWTGVAGPRRAWLHASHTLRLRPLGSCYTGVEHDVDLSAAGGLPPTVSTRANWAAWRHMLDYELGSYALWRQTRPVPPTFGHELQPVS